MSHDICHDKYIHSFGRFQKPVNNFQRSPSPFVFVAYTDDQVGTDTKRMGGGLLLAL